MFSNSSSSTNSVNGGGALLCRDRGEYAGADPFDDVKTLFLALVPPYFLVTRDDSVGVKIFWVLLSLILYPLQLIYFVGCLILLLLVLAPFVAFIWFLLCC